MICSEKSSYFQAPLIGASAARDIALSLWRFCYLCGVGYVLAVLVACLLLPARSFAWQIATPHVELGRQIFFDWARKEGRNAELADKRAGAKRSADFPS